MVLKVLVMGLRSNYRGVNGARERGSFCVKAAGSPLARDAVMMMPFAGLTYGGI